MWASADLTEKPRHCDLVPRSSCALVVIIVFIFGILIIDLPLPLSVLGHEGGTVLVSLNGLCLLVFRMLGV